MFFLVFFTGALLFILIVEKTLMKAELKQRRNDVTREYYNAVRVSSDSLEDEIDTLKVYRHDLNRYIRILQKPCTKIRGEKAEEYLQLLQTEAERLEKMPLER